MRFEEGVILTAKLPLMLVLYTYFDARRTSGWPIVNGSLQYLEVPWRGRRSRYSVSESCKSRKDRGFSIGWLKSLNGNALVHKAMYQCNLQIGHVYSSSCILHK